MRYWPGCTTDPKWCKELESEMANIRRGQDVATEIERLTAENERLRAALTEIVGMFRETQFGTTELDLPNYEVLEVARNALDQQISVNSVTPKGV